MFAIGLCHTDAITWEEVAGVKVQAENEGLWSAAAPSSGRADHVLRQASRAS